MSQPTRSTAPNQRPRRPRTALLGMALAFGLVASTTPVAIAKPSTATSTKQTSKHGATAKTAKAKAKAKAKTKAKSKRGGAASAAVTSLPLLHTVSIDTSPAPESGNVRSEMWIERGETARRGHVTTTSLDSRWKSTESWDSPTFSVLLLGDLGIAPLERFRSRKAYCLDDPTAAPGASGLLYREFQRGLLAEERDVLTLVDGLQRDAAARAALPAGTTIDGHATVTWINPQKVFSDLFGEQPKDQYWFDAATGRVLRSQHGWTDSWRDYSTWEILPAGSDASTIDPPQDLIDASGCTWR